MNDTLPDIQCTEPKIKKAIQQVGVQNIELPFILDSRDGGARQMVADVSMRTNLDENILVGFQLAHKTSQPRPVMPPEAILTRNDPQFR